MIPSLYSMAQIMIFGKLVCLIIRAMDPNLERIVDICFSPPMDFRNLSCEDEKNLYLDAQASNVIVNALSYVVTSSIIPF